MRTLPGLATWPGYLALLPGPVARPCYQALLPGLAAGLTLGRADQLGPDPTAVETAGLRPDGSTVHQAVQRR
jgi:hypothetical protein